MGSEALGEGKEENSENGRRTYGIDPLEEKILTRFFTKLGRGYRRGI